jgi:hypothetical protein
MRTSMLNMSPQWVKDQCNGELYFNNRGDCNKEKPYKTKGLEMAPIQTEGVHRQTSNSPLKL